MTIFLHVQQKSELTDVRCDVHILNVPRASARVSRKISGILSHACDKADTVAATHLNDSTKKPSPGLIQWKVSQNKRTDTGTAPVFFFDLSLQESCLFCREIAVR